MKFKINGNTWEIQEKTKEELKELYEQENDEALYVFGVTIKHSHIIYINSELCEEQKIRTLKHELAHCYIWEYGLYNAPSMNTDNEEFICDLVSASHDFITDIVNKYKDETDNIEIIHADGTIVHKNIKTGETIDKVK